MPRPNWTPLIATILRASMVPEIRRKSTRLIADGLLRSGEELTTDKVVMVAGLSGSRADKVRRALKGVDVSGEMARLDRAGYRFVSIVDEEYPPRLTSIYNPPLGLFVSGLPLESADMVSVVGSRKSTSYGRNVASVFGKTLAGVGINVVSGLALGIDSAAHRGALEAGRTVAVLGCGLDQIYPAANRSLRRSIENEGTIVTEYPLGTRPTKFNFPERNRIIAGLSVMTVVVEAGEKSGALITADRALDEGRDVLVVPGLITSESSRGCHRLLQQGAGVVTGPACLLEALGKESAKAEKTALGGDERTILSIISPHGQTVDSLAAACDLPVPAVLSAVTGLEARRLLYRGPGGLLFVSQPI